MHFLQREVKAARFKKIFLAVIRTLFGAMTWSAHWEQTPFSSGALASDTFLSSENDSEPGLSEEEMITKSQLLEVQKSIKDKETQLNALQLSLDREFDRNGKLRQKLLTEYRQGCRANERIKALEILIAGQHLPDGDWDKSFTSSEKISTGNPAKISLSLSEEITLINENEETTPLFISKGYLISKSFESFTAKDISTIKISKGGIGYTADLNCWSIFGWSKWGLGKNCEWQNREKNIYKLDSLEIKINGAKFFSSRDIAFKFSSTDQNWQESNLSKSSDYVDFMTSTECIGEK